MKKYFSAFLMGVFFIGCCYLCFFLGQFHPKLNNENIEIKRDTLVILDTIKIEKPVNKVRWKTKDTLIYIPIKDTIIVKQNDTVYIALQEERVEYREKEYRAIISGVNPKLEEISIYPKTVYITETQKQVKTSTKHWGINITIGPSLVYDFNNRQINGGLGIVAGIGYSF